MTNHTEAITFRFDKTMLNQLRAEAEQKQISLNTLLNHVVRSHIEWHANAARAGFVPIRREVLKWLFDQLTKEQVNTLAEGVAQGLTDETMMIMTRKRTEESIFELLERWIRVAGFNYRHEISGDARIFIIQHNMGGNWSHYISKLIEHAAAEFVTVKPDIQTTENAVFIIVKGIRS